MERERTDFDKKKTKNLAIEFEKELSITRRRRIERTTRRRRIRRTRR